MIELEYLCILRRSDNFPLIEIQNLNIFGKPLNIDHLMIIQEFNLDFSGNNNGSNSRRDTHNQETNEDISTNNNQTTTENNISNSNNHNSNNSNNNRHEVADIESKLQEITDEMNEVEKKHELEDIDLMDLESNDSAIHDIEDLENLLNAIPEVIKYTHIESDREHNLYCYFVLSESIVLICVAKQFNKILRKNLIQFLRAFENNISKESIERITTTIQATRFSKEFSEIFAQNILNEYLIAYSSPSFLMDSINDQG
ncbi:MAG: hypothetical protein GF364_19380, partial [Candidatus Lokiarchaeota archaeon]|nr:hypothetical protein [Candidatus Lokiarchaeota archaeon]